MILKGLLIVCLALFEIVAALCEIVTSSIAGLLGIIRVYLLRNYSYLKWLKRDLADCESILELGCGSNSPIIRIGYGHKTDTVDIFEPYIEKHNRNHDYRECHQADILEMRFPEKKYDAVVMLDVLEHLPRDIVERTKLMERMEQCAKKKVIFFTPNGYVENDLVDGDEHQAHVSAWEPIDYQKRGYKVHGATGIRWVLGKASLPKYHPYSVFAIVAMCSMPVIYNRPEIGWHSYAVREIR